MSCAAWSAPPSSASPSPCRTGTPGPTLPADGWPTSSTGQLPERADDIATPEALLAELAEVPLTGEAAGRSTQIAQDVTGSPVPPMPPPGPGPDPYAVDELSGMAADLRTTVGRFTC